MKHVSFLGCVLVSVTLGTLRLCLGRQATPRALPRQRRTHLDVMALLVPAPTKLAQVEALFNTHAQHPSGQIACVQRR
jgi:hypothetical protein